MVNETYYAKDSELGLMKMNGDSMVLILGGEQMNDKPVGFMLSIPNWPNNKFLIGTDVELYVYDQR